MTGSMPYVASGASFALLESLLNGDGSREHKLAVLRAIEAADHLMDAALQFGDTPEIREYITHINVDWFGLTRNGTNWGPQKPFDETTNRTTGWWAGGYIEDAEGICRQGAVAALKLALGLDDEGNPTRNDHIGALWICAGDSFSVVLRRWLDETVLLFITPVLANREPTGDLDSGPFAGGTDYACPPTDFTKANALWIVSHREWQGSQQAFVMSGHIDTVQPSIEDGGVN
jgi:hypothetical protein